MSEYSNVWRSALASLIPAGFQAGSEGAGNALDAKSKLKNYIGQLQASTETANNLHDQHPGMNVKAGDVGIDNPMGGIRAQMQDVALQEKLGEKMVKVVSGIEAAKDVENVSNTDGQGGIFSNPNAKLKSPGMISATLGAKGVGAAEGITHGISSLAGLLSPRFASTVQKYGMPDGSTEEAKALERFQNAATSSLTGGGQSTDSARDAVNTMMGNIASSDQNLRAKGAQAAGGMLRQSVKSQTAGFQPHQVQEYNKRMYGDANADPTAFLSKIPDNSIATKQRMMAQQNRQPVEQPPSNGAGGQSALASPSQPKRAVSQQDVQAYAQKHQMEPQAAAKYLQSQGYTVGN